ncbi:DUF7109 family protein [Natronoarchaeum rubrum]|uniref:DUF7109 family protein n=1 Tax=Natronoarchaeum rubrum TaxID=755311 RepID=UPI002112E0C5|nr:hypothetical protein [Natronoarchaeum rubrum]
MSATLDELAGVVDLFDGLTREELSRALIELGARRGDDPDEDAVAESIETAVDRYFLARYERADGDDLLVPGPAAFPSVPEHGEDLPHIMDVPDRSLDRERLGEQVAERLAADADAAIEDGDAERVEALIDVTYDVEAWAPVELDDVRARLDAALADA